MSDASALGRLRRAVVEAATSISGWSLDVGFTAVLLVWIVVLLVLTPRYSAEARLFPLLVTVPTLVVLVVLLVSQLSPAFAARLGSLSGISPVSLGDTYAPPPAAASEGPATDRETARRNVASISLWILVSMAAILVFGFSLGSLAFLVAFYWKKTDLSWKPALAYVLVIWLFIFLIFGVVLNTPFYEGYLFEDLLGLV